MRRQESDDLAAIDGCVERPAVITLECEGDLRLRDAGRNGKEYECRKKTCHQFGMRMRHGNLRGRTWTADTVQTDTI